MGDPGMMGEGPFGDPTWDPGGSPRRKATVSAAQARGIAERWLAARGAGLRAGEAERFPGYYTLHALRGRGIVGMLSVNASSGVVWYHW